MGFVGTPIDTVLNIVVVLGILLLGLGYTLRGPRSPLVRAAGWVLFSVYWPFQAHKFIESGEDPVNAFLTRWGPLVLLFFAWHEIKSYRWKEEVQALRWVSGTAAVAAGTFFVFEFVPAWSRALEEFTARQTAVMLNYVFGLDVVASGTHLCFDATCSGASSYAVTIILACTAIQSIMIFVGAILCLDAPSRRRWRAAFVAVPIIYVLNLFRNAGIVYGYKILEWNPLGWGPINPFTGAPDYAHGSFIWMHAYVGKFGSLGALIVIALAVFLILPELHQNILDLWDLLKRKRPGFFKDRPGPARPESIPAAPPQAASGAVAEKGATLRD